MPLFGPRFVPRGARSCGAQSFHQSTVAVTHLRRDSDQGGGMRHRAAIGERGERYAARRLTRQGWRLIASNARTRRGEIDLIALDGRDLVFVEVKTRLRGSSAGPARAVEAVGARKRARLRTLAREWLGERPAIGSFEGIRFDVIGIEVEAGRVVGYEHLRAAF